MATSLTNIGLYNDGQLVSSSIEMSGRDIVFELNFEITAGDTESLEIRGDVIGAERTPETYEFRVRNETDITVIEAQTGFSAPVNFLSTPLSL